MIQKRFVSLLLCAALALCLLAGCDTAASGSNAPDAGYTAGNEF